MGLMDRDNARETRQSPGTDAPFSPPESTAHGWVIAVTAVVCIACLSLKACQWWGAQLPTHGTPSRAAPQRAADGAPGPSIEPPQDLERSKADRGVTVVKCVSASGITLSNGPCEANTKATVVSRYTESRASSEPSSTTASSIYLCRAYNGSAFWAEAHCNQHNALIEQIVPVPGNLPWAQKVQLAEQERARGMAAPVAAAPPQPAAMRHPECLHLDARVAQLDAWAREPLGPAEQDRIRSERQFARDRQFALKCGSSPPR
ncbi:hypothetical protein [Ramlibacter humi]|uniref:DUF4124 domain-containing protein n=1 Tax=Ramlibacter humi TaxID=2530451 RepID=A0A4Z0BTW3_9BURK|nr:hypothetical protein [Ramlibacter humi]TFZ01914.1 hypothetical protein EZ216_12050 [Ramlibacter humi]